MSGGKIVRIVGGKFTQECDTLTYYQDNFTINSGGKIRLTCDGEMIYGKPEVPPAGKYFIRGEWTSDWEGNNKITKANLGDIVYFQVYTQGLEKGETITFTLYDDDAECRWIWDLYAKLNKECEDDRDEIPLVIYNQEEQTYISRTSETVDENGKVVLFIELTDSSFIRNLLDNEEDHVVELYFEFTCKEETVRLPENTDDYLKVGYNPYDNIVISPAYKGYKFPELFTLSGNRIVIFLSESEPEGTDVAGAAINIGQTLLDETEVKNLYRKTYQIAVREVEHGRLATNYTDIIKTSKRIYKTRVVEYAWEGTEFKVKRAVNFGFKNAFVNNGKLVTTKGINQLEYFARAGLKNQALRFSAKFLETGVLDVAALIQNAADGKISIFPPMDLIIDYTLQEIEEDMEEQFLVDLENAKRKGVEALQRMVSSDQRAITKFYNLEFVSNETLQAILSGKIKDFMKIYDYQLKYNDRPKNNYLLIRQTVHPKENKGIYVIESIFVSDDFIK